jgi:hypothetical protein
MMREDHRAHEVAISRVTFHRGGCDFLVRPGVNLPLEMQDASVLPRSLFGVSANFARRCTGARACTHKPTAKC